MKSLTPKYKDALPFKSDKVRQCYVESVIQAASYREANQIIKTSASGQAKIIAFMKSP
jgi:hypothetical protein